MQDLAPGDTINTKYVIESKIGAGGMGSVYLAVQLPLARRVALKLMGVGGGRPLPPQKLEAVKRRFFREASLCARLQHPNVITIYDYGEVDSGPGFGSYFLAMEYLQGETLDSRIQSNAPMPAGQVISIAIEIVRGLRDAHSHGIVHRDLKPDNIMLVPSDEGEDALDRVVILDFGLVQEFGEERGTHITSDDIIVGTPMYIAPEQILRKGPDPRSDIYSLGLVLYEALTGEHPFSDPTVVGMLQAQLAQIVPKLREKTPTANVSPDLERLIAKMLEKDPTHRFQSTDELLKELRTLPEADSSLSVIIPKGTQAAPAIVVNTTSQYQLGQRLSRGTRSIVCEATHNELGRKVVVKLLVPSSPEEEARIVHALPTLALLRHPANVRVYDIGTAKSGSQTIPFCVMEQLRGEKLADRLQRAGKLETSAVMAIGSQLLQALAEAHTLGLVHGNLDPGHVVMISNMGGDLVKVFGYPVAPLTEHHLASMMPPAPVTSPYVAPEVVGGAWPKEASDVFSLGAILHACMTGSTDVPLPSEPADLCSMLQRATASRITERFDSIRAFWQAWRTIESSGASVPAMSVAMSRRSMPSVSAISTSAAEPTAPEIPEPEAPPHQIWLLDGDPGLDGPVVEKATQLLPSEVTVLHIPKERHEAMATMLMRGDIGPPSLVLLGLVHGDQMQPLLDKLSSCRPTRRVLIATALHAEAIARIVNACGLDQILSLPSTALSLASNFEQMLMRVDTRQLRYLGPTIASSTYVSTSSSTLTSSPVGVTGVSSTRPV